MSGEVKTVNITQSEAFDCFVKILSYRSVIIGLDSSFLFNVIDFRSGIEEISSTNNQL